MERAAGRRHGRNSSSAQGGGDERMVSAETLSSRTAPPPHSTAWRLGKQYAESWPVSSDPKKDAARTSDGYVNSAQYLSAAQRQRSQHSRDAGHNGDAAGPGSFRGVDLDYHHWLEDVLGKRPCALLGFCRARGGTVARSFSKRLVVCQSAG